MTLAEKLTAYLRGTREEIRKVSWPTRQDTIRYSMLVITITVVISAFFALLDFGFSQLVNYAAEKRSEAIVNQLNKPNQPDVTPTTSSTTPSSSTSSVPTIDVNALKSAGQSSNGDVQVQSVQTIPAPSAAPSANTPKK